MRGYDGALYYPDDEKVIQAARMTLAKRGTCTRC
jgi:hypothetical protein